MNYVYHQKFFFCNLITFPLQIQSRYGSALNPTYGVNNYRRYLLYAQISPKINRYNLWIEVQNLNYFAFYFLAQPSFKFVGEVILRKFF